MQSRFLWFKTECQRGLGPKNVSSFQLRELRSKHVRANKVLASLAGIDLGNNNFTGCIYKAACIKMQQQAYKEWELQKETGYVGNFVYQDGPLACILTDKGRLVPKEAGGYEYEYYN